MLACEAIQTIPRNVSGEDDLDDGQGAEAQRDIVVPGSGDHHDVLCGSVGQLKTNNVI